MTDQPSDSFISHELRTPLNHIIGYSELLIEEVEDNQQTAFVAPLQQIRSLGKQLVSMLGGVFNKEAPEAPLLRLQTARDDLGKVIGQVRQLNADLQAAQEMADLLPDLKKIDSAADHFMALLEQFLQPKP